MNAPSKSTALVPVRTLEQALSGTENVDYFPNETCETCGAIVWFDGRRYQQTHDDAKHATVDAPRRIVTEAGRVVEVDERLTRGVRRTMGDRDDD